MLPTHALAGMAFALSATPVAPEFAGVALVAGLLGGVFPDLDLYAGHRKSLHYPVYYSVLAVPTLAAAAVVPAAATVFAGFFVAAAALHSVTDVFGGGLELRPWEATSDRAVYDHHGGRWIAPRRWVGYDGSPSDLLLSATLAVPLLLTVEAPLDRVVMVAVAVAVVYTAVRRLLPTVADRLVDVVTPRLPDHVVPYVPPRYRDE
ncbi:metal-dependent hydrolase [Halostella litorea]|uniref:metal-dependent hydrolase n=1 Tax=Halostella litorea TaxID=2528831 RepID=UPI001091E640